ncbi:MAG: Bax inhibitor-1/YccA family protein [Chloroflexi bacterium]|nr:Bax inhibitor-1/YccA family protein [Chloroflexota bacterium]
MDVYRPQPQTTTLGRVNLRAVMQEVYLWMTIGLLISAAVAITFAATGLTVALAPVLMIAMFAQIGLVWYLAARIMKMDAQRATRVFLLYAALNGATLSFVFFWADLSDVYLALFATGAMFAAMSIIGYTTSIDLTRMGGFLFMALIGLIVASVINIFFASETLYWLVTYAGVLIFVALTAYDTQWIKRSAQQMEIQGVPNEAALVRRVAIMGALKLYLDFINLFIYILRILAGSRD